MTESSSRMATAFARRHLGAVLAVAVGGVFAVRIVGVAGSALGLGLTVVMLAPGALLVWPLVRHAVGSRTLQVALSATLGLVLGCAACAGLVAAFGWEPGRIVCAFGGSAIILLLLGAWMRRRRRGFTSGEAITTVEPHRIVVSISIIIALCAAGIPFLFFGAKTQFGYAYAQTFALDGFSKMATTSALSHRIAPESPWLAGHRMARPWLTFVWPAYLHKASDAVLSVPHAIMLANLVTAALLGPTIAGAAQSFVQSRWATFSAVALALLADGYQALMGASHVMALAPAMKLFDKLEYP